MCRLFGFKSVIPSQVHSSLLEADNALGVQSEAHPDGWGVAYYVDGTPQVVKSAEQALSCQIFRKVSGVAASETVVAHVRKATVGNKTILNSHPFQHGRWVFAHNGDIPDFEDVRELLLQEITPCLRRYVLGETDSEAIFFVFLSRLARHGSLANRYSADVVMDALEQTVDTIKEICGDREKDKAPMLTCLVTDGSTLVAKRLRKELYWSSYKTSCSDRDSCPSFAPECEAATQTGFVNHLIFSSEPLGGQNVWLEVPEDGLIGADWRMKLVERSVSSARSGLPIAS